MKFTIADGKKQAKIFVGQNEFPGVKRVARKVLGDLKLVTGRDYVLEEGMPDNRELCGCIIAGVIGSNTMLDTLVKEKRLDLSDVIPSTQGSVILTEDVNMVSKEPSVKYRGFFINDEWPSFGNWTFKHFGGFTAEMYDKVFELLLRLKGNYLWPAMWSSSFSLDGPGMESALLADV